MERLRGEEGLGDHPGLASLWAVIAEAKAALAVARGVMNDQQGGEAPGSLAATA